MNTEKHPMPALTEQEREAAKEMLLKAVAETPDNDEELILSIIAQIALAALTAEPTYHINRIGGRDSWGDYVEIRAYESELDASKSKDDFGGNVVVVYGAPPVPVLKPIVFPSLSDDRYQWSDGAFNLKSDMVLMLRASGYEVKE